MLINYIPLAKAMPEVSKRDGKQYVCSLGYDQTLGFIRVYPTPLDGIDLWTPIQFKAERNKRDSRAASWKMPEDCRHGEWSVNKKMVSYGQRISSSAQLTLLKKMMQKTVSSISELNEKRQSIGFLIVPNFRIVPEENPLFINTTQFGMFEDVEIADFTRFTKHSRETMFRVRFEDEDGQHNLQFNRWDIWETARKFGASKAVDLFSNPGPHLLMLGNYLQHQTSWSVLGIWSVPVQLDLFNES